jgi:hypothetical protein
LILQEFEDLDEITARFIQPMAAFARDLLGHKYFHECHGGDRKVGWLFYGLGNTRERPCLNKGIKK